MSKYCIEDAFKSLDEVMSENRKTLTESLGEDDPAKQTALSIARGYAGGKLVSGGEKLQLFSNLGVSEIREVAAAINDALIDYGKAISEDSIINKKDKTNQKTWIGTYSFTKASENSDWDNYRKYESLKEDYDDEIVSEIIEWARDDYDNGKPVEDYTEFSKICNDMGIDPTEDLYQVYMDNCCYQDDYDDEECEDDSCDESVKEDLTDDNLDTKYLLTVHYKNGDVEDKIFTGVHSWQEAVEAALSDPEVDSVDDLGECLEESKETLTERIPKDLKKSMLNTYTRRNYNRDDLLKGIDKRRRAAVDFEKTTYKELTPEEAKKILKADPSALSDMYFIINRYKGTSWGSNAAGLQVAKYDDSGKLVTDVEVSGASDNIYTRKSGEPVPKVAFWPIKYVIDVAEHIYLSDEKNWPISHPGHDAYFDSNNLPVDLRGYRIDQSNTYDIHGNLRSNNSWDQMDTGKHNLYSEYPSSRYFIDSGGKKVYAPGWGDTVKYCDRKGEGTNSHQSVSYLKKRLNNAYDTYKQVKASSTATERDLENAKKTVQDYENAYIVAKQGHQMQWPENNYVTVMLQKDKNELKDYRKQLDRIIKNAKRFQDDRYRDEYTENEGRIKDINNKIANLQTQIQNLQKELVEIQALQTPELRSESESIFNDKMSEYMDEYERVEAAMNELNKKYHFDTQSALGESLEGAEHYRLYVVDENNEESLISEDEFNFSSEEACVEKAKELNNTDKYTRIVAIKIIEKPESEKADIVELWDSNDSLSESALYENLIKNVKQRITEARAFDLKDTKEVVDAMSYGSVDDSGDEVLVAVDPSLESTDETFEPHVGDALLQCRSCKTNITKDVNDLVKEEDSDIYNIEDKCPHCGATTGYVYIAQLSSPDSEDAKELEAEDTPEEVKAEANLEVSEPVESTESGIENAEVESDEELEEIQEESFDTKVSEHLQKLYENIVSYKTSNIIRDGENLILEGILTSPKGKTITTSFVLSQRKDNDKYILEGVNDTFKNDIKTFTLTCNLENKALICESIDSK